MRSDLVLVLLSTCLLVNGKKTAILTQHEVCAAKATCERCLQLAHCVWCGNREKGPRCFPARLKDHVQCDPLLEYTEKLLSAAESAECVCRGGEGAALDARAACVPPGAPEGTEACSARGSCECGRCACAAFENDPTKMVTGQYCECDNFSCEGRDCSEGPYCVNVTAPPLPPDSVEGNF